MIMALIEKLHYQMLKHIYLVQDLVTDDPTALAIALG